MHSGKTIRTAAAGLLGCAALAAAYQAGRLQPPREVRVVEKVTEEVPVPVAVPVPVPVAVPIAVEFRGRPAEPLPPSPEEPAVEVDPNLCVQNLADGSRAMWVRAQSRTSVTKYEFAPDGTLSFVTNLRLDCQGNPLGAKIHNGQNELIYHASYGYHAKTGALVAEVLFDRRDGPILGPDRKELPVRRVNYGVADDGGETQEIAPLPHALAENGAEKPPMPSPFSMMAFPKGW